MVDVKGKRIVLLTSGGPDSTTLAKFVEKEGGQAIAALYLRSGHATDEREIEAAKKLASQHGIAFDVIDVSAAISKLGGGKIMMHAGARLMEFGSSIFFSVAIAYAMRREADAIAVAVHRDDAAASSQYGPAFLDKFNELARVAYPHAPVVLAPFMGLTKPEVFRLGAALGVEYADTWSCCDGLFVHCGSCGACEARKRAFRLSGIEDPTTYAVADTPISAATTV